MVSSDHPQTKVCTTLAQSHQMTCVCVESKGQPAATSFLWSSSSPLPYRSWVLKVWGILIDWMRKQTMSWWRGTLWIVSWRWTGYRGYRKFCWNTIGVGRAPPSCTVICKYSNSTAQFVGHPNYAILLVYLGDRTRRYLTLDSTVKSRRCQGQHPTQVTGNHESLKNLWMTNLLKSFYYQVAKSLELRGISRLFESTLSDA